MATILTCMLFGAISCSGQATFAAVGSIMIPSMEAQGYNKKFVTGLTASSGGLGVLIPPSLPMVIYGITVGVSIGDLFSAGILPGILCGVCLMIYAYIYCRSNPVSETAVIEEINPATAHIELPLGRLQGVHPRRLVEFLTANTPITPRQVGDIEIQGNSTLVEVPMIFVDQIYSAFSKFEKSLKGNKRARMSGNRRSASKQAN
jgi:C4-dicarboxylate transporter DctM subunit